MTPFRVLFVHGGLLTFIVGRYLCELTQPGAQFFQPKFPLIFPLIASWALFVWQSASALRNIAILVDQLLTLSVAKRPRIKLSSLIPPVLSRDECGTREINLRLRARRALIY